MTEEIVAVKTRYHYDSYRDLRTLFDLASFPSCYVDEIDISKPVTYIVSPMNGEFRPHIANEYAKGKPRFCNLILWNIERAGGGDTKALGTYTQANWELMGHYTEERKEELERKHRQHGEPPAIMYVDRVWVSDRKLAEYTGLHYAVLGSHPDLGEPGPEQGTRWDITHISALNGRRSQVLDQLSNRDGYNPEKWDDCISPNCWPPERDEVLKQSRFALNIHQDDGPFSEPLRFALFAAYGLPILSETILDAHPYGKGTMTFTRHHDLVDTMRRLLLEPYDKHREMGMICRRMMTEEFEFGKMVRKAVEETVGWR